MSDNAAWQRIDQYVDENIDYWLRHLARLCAQPSVSAQNLGIEACAELVATMLREEGYEAEIMPSGGSPVVYGEGAGQGDKTLLFYLHYDVQPPEPLDLWDSPPFELTRRDGKLFARGVCDDKGHIITRLAALAAVRYALGELPCNVKFFVEGEEEIGSPHTPAFIEAHRERLAGDACIWEFGGVDGEGRPEQSLGMRGICYVELSVETARADAHSGLGGSVFPNAAWRLVWALNTLKDEAEQILIPGYYDDVVPPSERDLEMLSRLPDQSAMWQDLFQLDHFVGGVERGVPWKVQASFRPSCTICGLESGYQGEGAKTVLPARATAKVDFRLVPDQTPEAVVAGLRRHLDEQGFQDVRIRLLGGLRPARIDPDDPFVQLALRTAVDVYGQEMVVSPLIGGSGPLYPFVEWLDVPVVAAGIGYPQSNVHAPNENIRLDDLVKGIKHTARIVEAFGRGRA